MKEFLNTKGNKQLTQWVEAEEQNLRRSLYKGKLSLDERRNMKTFHESLHTLCTAITSSRDTLAHTSRGYPE